MARSTFPLILNFSCRVNSGWRISSDITPQCCCSFNSLYRLPSPFESNLMPSIIVFLALYLFLFGLGSPAFRQAIVSAVIYIRTGCRHLIVAVGSGFLPGIHLAYLPASVDYLDSLGRFGFGIDDQIDCFAGSLFSHPQNESD